MPSLDLKSGAMILRKHGNRDNHVLDPGLVPRIRETSGHLVGVAYRDNSIEVGGDGGANEDLDEAHHGLLSSGTTEHH
jgi:hypothetical protein